MSTIVLEHAQPNILQEVMYLSECGRRTDGRMNNIDGPTHPLLNKRTAAMKKIVMGSGKLSLCPFSLSLVEFVCIFQVRYFYNIKANVQSVIKHLLLDASAVPDWDYF